MDQNRLINKLRILINHLPLMDSEKQTYAVGKANEMIDKYFLSGGWFVEIDPAEFIQEVKKKTKKSTKPEVSPCTCSSGMAGSHFCEKHQVFVGGFRI